MNENKKQVITETKVSFDNEKMVVVVRNGEGSSKVTLTDKSIVIDLEEQKNTPKGVYVGKCPKCRYENKRQMTNWQLENGLPNFCSQCGARTTYRKHQFV